MSDPARPAALATLLLIVAACSSAASADPNAIQFPVHTLTVEQVAALGIDAPEGGFQGMSLIGPDGKAYSFSLRPLLPGDKA